MHLIGLSADHQEPANVAGRQLSLERCGLEGIAVVFLDTRLAVGGHELRHDLPRLAPRARCSSSCWTQTTGTRASRARSTSRAMFATTPSGPCASATTPV